jgi:signal transduction histidine kinase
MTGPDPSLFPKGATTIMENDNALSLVQMSSQVARLKARVAGLRALQDVARDLTAELDLDRLLHKILRAAVNVMGCTAGSLLLCDPATSDLVFEVVEGGGGDSLEKTRIRSDQGIAGYAFTQRQPIVVEDAMQDERYYAEVARRYNLQIHRLIAVPLIAKGSAIGVLEIMNRTTRESFSEDDRELLLAFASQSAIAIENARLYQSLVRERDRILAVEASVRQEIARDLHDGPAQILSAIIMSVRLMRELIDRSPERLGDELLHWEALGQKALYQVRNLLFDLRPVILETHGLGPALEAYADRMRLVEPFSLSVDVHSLTTRFKPNVESAIFSIVQEAVNNAKTHAAPSRLWITGLEDGSMLKITVRDDGRGFDLARVEETYAERNSFGLLNMRERAEIAHGRLEIQSKQGRGTLVTLIVPVG